jgi:putative spermidine/putrescine transport system permease protein
MTGSTILRRLFMAAVALFLAAPLVVVAGVSLNEKRRLLFPPDGVSVAWYAALFADAGWMGALRNSVTIAVGAALLSVSIALPLAWFLWRYRVRYARVLFTIGVAPFVLPPVITALGFLVFWTSVGLYGNMGATIVSHGIFFVTLPLVNLSLGLESIERETVEAARTLGADEGAVFRTVVFPGILPYLASSLAFVFVLSINEYIVAYMVSGFTVETVPIKIFNSLRYGYTPIMAVVAVLFVAVSFTAFGLMAKGGRLLRILGRP